MMHFFTQGYQRLSNMLWAIIVAYMIGLHNMYKQEQKAPDDIVIRIVDESGQEDERPV